MEQRNLIIKVKEGNVDAFDEVYMKFSPRVYGFAIRYFRNKEEAEEIVQEVFISLWKYKAKIDVNRNFDAYLFTITFNAIRKRFRELYRERKSVEEYQTNINLSLDDVTRESEYHNLHEIVMKAVESLPPRQKEIYFLSREQGFSNTEIAGELKISKKTVENQLNRAIRFIKGVLVKSGVTGLLFALWLG